MHPKHHIVITAPELNVVAEGQWISALLRLGIGKVHIRKPQATADEIARLLENIPRTLRHRCILSEHSDLASIILEVCIFPSKVGNLSPIVPNSSTIKP